MRSLPSKLSITIPHKTLKSALKWYFKPLKWVEIANLNVKSGALLISFNFMRENSLFMCNVLIIFAQLI